MKSRPEITLCGPRGDEKIALRSSRLKAKVTGWAQRIELEQIFQNLETRAVEVIYTGGRGGHRLRSRNKTGKTPSDWGG